MQWSGVGGEVGNGDIADEFPLVWRETENSAFREGMCTMGGALCLNTVREHPIVGEDGSGTGRNQEGGKAGEE